MYYDAVCLPEFNSAMYYARFANRTQFPKQNGVEAEKLVKTVRFGQRRLIENWVKY